MFSIRSIRVKIVIFASLILGSAYFAEAAFNFKDDFSTPTIGIWRTNLQMGRDGIALPPYSLVMQAAGGVFQVGTGAGTPNGNSSGRYDGAWCSGMMVESNKKYSATSMNPFGVETYLRSWLMNNGAPGGSIASTCEIGLWLINDSQSSIANYTTEGNNFDNKAIFFHIFEDFAAAPKSTWGCFVNGTEFKFNMAAAVRADGYRTVNLSSLNGITALGAAVNTNIQIRLVNDGSQILCYMNPNPNRRAGTIFPAEFCLVGSYPVTWNDDLRFALAQEIRYKSSYANFNSDYVLVRTAVNSYTPDILTYPGNQPTVSASSNSSESNRKWLVVRIQPQISTSNSGINIVTVDKPANWGAWATISLTNEVRVLTGFKGGAGLNTNVSRPFSRYTNIATNQVSLRTNGGRLWIRLGKAITSSLANTEIDVVFKMTTALGAPDQSQHTFTTTVDSVLIDPILNKQTNYSTCGPQTSSDFIVLSSTVKGPADGFSSIIPNQIVQGNSSYSFTYYLQSSTNLLTLDVGQAAILIPDSFVVNTNSIDSFKINQDSTYISVVDGSTKGLTGAGTNVILINYGAAGASLGAGGEMDIITFSIKGNSTKGNWQWKTWVDGSSVSAGSLTTRTNGVFLSQKVRVIGAPPKIEGGLVTASSPKVLFNTLTVNTLFFKLRNTADLAEVDNKIWQAEIEVPKVFTNVSVVTSLKVPLTAVRVGKLTNTTSVTLYYSRDNDPILPGGTDFDIVTLKTYHRLTNSRITNVGMTATVNNSNGQGFLPLYVKLITNILITDPQPIGSANITVDDGTLYASDVTNAFTYNVYNTAPSGSILVAYITLPTNTFAFATNIVSARPGATASRNKTTLVVNYSGNPLPSNSSDIVTFRGVDKYTNFSAFLSATVPCRLANSSKTNDAVDKDAGLGLTRFLSFFPQEQRVRAFLTNNNQIDTAVTTSTLSYVFENYGDPGNRVSYAEGTFTGAGGGGVISAITKATSSLSGLWSVAGLTFSKSSYNLAAGQRDSVKLIISDTISAETVRDILPRVTVNTSVLRTASTPQPRTNRVFFQTPAPVATARVSPNVTFTSPTKTTNRVTVSIFNAGLGSNKFDKAIIWLPTILQNKVSGLSSLGTVTTFPDRIAINYVPIGSLNTQVTDQVVLMVTNSIAAKTNLSWTVWVSNNAKTSFATAMPGGQLTLYVVPRPPAYISAPAFISDSTVTNQLTYILPNTNNGGRKIMKARIAIPGAVYQVITNTVNSAKGLAVEKVTNGYVLIDYSQNYLSPGESDTITFKVTDNVNKATNRSSWRSEVQYFTNDSFYYTATNAGSQSILIQLAPALGRAGIVPNYAYTTSLSNTFLVSLTNSGTGGNYISASRVFVPAVLTANAGRVTSTRLSNEALYLNFGAGFFTLLYKPDGHVLNPVTVDTMTLRMPDSITNVTTATLLCQVNNRLDPVSDPTYTAATADLRINYVFPADCYLTPSAVDTTTSTNIYTFRINNQGKYKPVDRAVIFLPGLVSAVVSAASSKVANDAANVRLSGVTAVTLAYGADANGALQTTELDTVTLRLVDNFTKGATNVTFRAWINDATGWVDTLTTTGQSKSVAFSMPAASSSAWVTPTEIYTTKATNRFVYAVTNTGNGSNDLEKAVIVLPGLFTSVVNASNTHCASAANVRISGVTTITLAYLADANGKLKPGEKDTIVFRCVKSGTNISAGVTIDSLVDNGNGSGLSATAVPAGLTKTVKVGDPASFSLVPSSVLTTTASNLFTFSVNNSGAGSSATVYKVLLTVPAIFTNVKVQSGVSAATNIKYTNARVTALYSAFSYPAGDTIKLRAFDNLSQGSSNVTWTAWVDKNDGNGWILAKNAGMGVSFTMPQAFGSSRVLPNSLQTITVTNTYTVTVTNTGADLNRIRLARIVMPDIFNAILTNSLASAVLTNEAGSVQVVSNHILLVRYFRESRSIPTASQDTISFRGVDRILEKTNCSASVLVANTTNTASLVDTGIIAGGSKVLNFVKPDPAASAYAVPNTVSVFDQGTVYTVRVKNDSSANNTIYRVRIYLPAFLTNLQSVQSVRIVNDALNIATNMAQHYVELNYGGFGETNRLVSSATDTVTFQGFHSVSKATQFAVQAFVDNNNGNGFFGAGLWLPNSLTVGWVVPAPQGASSIGPTLVMADTLTNLFAYFITNRGAGNNSLTRVVIRVPAGITSLPTITSAKGATIRSTVTAVTLIYAGGLVTGDRDTVTIKAVDAIASRSNLSWSGLMNNGSGFSNMPALSLNAQLVKILNRPKGKINPVQIFDAFNTNQFSYEIRNDATGEPIGFARVLVPSAVYPLVWNFANSWGGAVTTTNAGYITVTYPSPLLAGQKDTISFNATDNVNKATNNSTWSSWIDYNDGQGWRQTTIPATEGTQYVRIAKASASADGTVTPNQVLLTSGTNTMTCRIVNSGLKGNYIREAYVYYPTAKLDVSGVASSELTNDLANAVVNDPAGYVNLRYFLENNLRTSATDTITFTLVDTITNLSTVTLLSRVDNGDGNGLVATTSLAGSKSVSFMPAGVDGYLTPNAADTSTLSNVFTYRLNNNGSFDAKRAVIFVPGIVTNILQVTSTHLASAANIRPAALGRVTSFTLYYAPDANGPLGAGGSGATPRQDVITIRAADNFRYGNTNISWLATSSNTTIGWASVVPTGGQLQTVAFSMPSPSVSAWLTPGELYTTAQTDVIVYTITNTGSGSSDIFDCVVSVPALFTNISKVTSSYLATRLPVSNRVTSFTLHYSANKLRPGQKDTVRITVRDSASAIDDTQAWLSTVRNTPTGSFFATSIPPLKTLVTKFAIPPSGLVAPSAILTTTLSNVFTLVINNSGAGGSSSISNVKLRYPALFTNVKVTNTAAGSVLSRSNGAIHIAYPSGLAFAAQDTLTIRMKDRFTTGSTNATWDLFVRKNDGNGFRPGVPASAGGLDLAVTMPSTFGQFAVKPSGESTLITSRVYTNLIYNTGADLNNIVFARIDLPGVFTNVTKVTSSLAPPSAIKVTNSRVFVYYTNGFPLRTGKTDTLRLTLIDNVTLNTTVTWGCLVANMVSTNSLAATGILSGMQKLVAYAKPAPSASAYVRTNAISAFDTATVFQAVVTNSGSSFNDIYAVRIAVPSLFTNISSLTSSFVGNAAANIVYTNGYVEVRYATAGKLLTAGAVDRIRFRAIDNVSTLTSAAWVVRMNNNNGSGFQTASEWLAKGSLTLVVSVPAPVVNAGITPNFIFEDTATNTFSYSLQNAGVGNNNIRQAVISLPAGVTVRTGWSGWLADDAAAMGISPTSVTLRYYSDARGSLTSGSNDTVTLILVDTYVGESSFRTVDCLVENGSGLFQATGVAGSKDFKVTYRPEATIWSNTLESESVTNTMRYKVWNKGNYASDIQSLSIPVPAGFTVVPGSIASAIIQTATNIHLAGNTITMNYLADAGDLSKLLTETVTFRVTDAYNKTTNSSFWDSSVDYNDGFGYRTTAAVGQSKRVFVKYSVPNVAIGVTPDKLYYTSASNTMTMVVANLGQAGNSVTRAQLVFPAGQVSVAAADVVSRRIAAPVINIFVSGGNTIDINYFNDGNPLSGQTSDTLTIRMADSITAVSSITLRLRADNSPSGDGSRYAPATGSGTVQFGTPPDVGFASAQALADTSVRTNVTYRYSLHNNSFQDLRRAVLVLPAAITNFFNIQSEVITLPANIRSTVSTITLDYEHDIAGSLPKDTYDYITFTARDSIERGNTNVLFDCYVDAGAGPVATITNSGTTKKMRYRMPNSSAYAYIISFSEPVQNRITVNSSTNDFAYVITNLGGGSDLIDKVRITIPAGFTVLTGSVTSTVPSAAVSIQPAYFDVSYPVGGGISPQTTATLHFRASDSVSAENSFTWPLTVDNMAGANPQTAAIWPGRKQFITSFLPSFVANVSVSPNTVYSTSETNTVYTVRVFNMSSDYIIQARLTIPPELSTNALAVQSAKIGNSSFIIVSNHTVLLDYAGAGTNISLSDPDTITISAKDNYTNGIYTNNTWGVTVRHSTAGQAFNPTIPSSSMRLMLVMPPASGSVNLTPNQVYTVQSKVDFVLKLTNTGTGRNYITQVDIQVPAIFTNGLGDTLTRITMVTSSLAGTVFLNGRGSWNGATEMLSLVYDLSLTGGLAAGAADTISLHLQNSSTNNSTNTFAVWLRNGQPNNDFTPAGLQRFEANVVRVVPSSARASAKIDAVGPTPRIINSTDVTNDFQYRIDNTGGLVDTIQRLRITVPTNDIKYIGSIQSANVSAAWITRQTNAGLHEIVVDYSNGGYNFNGGQGKYDVITFKAVDAYSSGSAGIFWDSQVAFNNGLGYFETDPLPSVTPNVKQIDLVHPPVSAVVSWTKSAIYTTNNNYSEYVELAVSNTGIGNNVIQGAVFTFAGPQVAYMTNQDPFLNPMVLGFPAPVVSFSMTKSGVTNNVQVVFATPIASGQKERVRFKFLNYFFTDEYRDLPVSISLSNGNPGQPYSALSPDLLMSILFPNKTIFEPSIIFDNQAREDDGTIYTINKSAEIRFQLLNKSPIYTINEAFIGFNFSIYTDLQVTSDNKGITAISQMTNGGRELIRIDYSANPLAINGDYDRLRLRFGYSQTNVSVTKMTTVVMFAGVAFTQHVGKFVTNQQSLRLEKAWWGQLSGTVFPHFKPINVKLYDSLGRQVIDIFTNSILATASDTNGVYLIDYIPAGAYNVKFYDEEGQFQSQYYLTNMQIASNRVTYATQVYMQNAKLLKEDGGTVTCYDDGQVSSVLIPANALASNIFIDLFIAAMSAGESSAMADNSTIDTAPVSGLTVLSLDLRTASGESLPGVPLKSTGRLTVHYDPVLAATNGWDTSSLAIYAWDESLETWVRVGGIVDTVNDTVEADVNYLFRTYAVLPSVDEETGAIRYVRCGPNPFTPSSRDTAFHSLQINWEMDKEYARVEVSIFNLKGELVRKKVPTVYDSKTCSESWDGRDEDGYPVQAGLYIVQIRADKNVHNNVILLAK